MPDIALETGGEPASEVMLGRASSSRVVSLTRPAAGFGRLSIGRIDTYLTLTLTLTKGRQTYAHCRDPPPPH